MGGLSFNTTFFGVTVYLSRLVTSLTLSYLLSEFRHAHLYHGYNTRSRDLLRPPFAKTA